MDGNAYELNCLRDHLARKCVAAFHSSSKFSDRLTRPSR